MIFNLLTTTLFLLILPLSCRGDVLSYVVNDLEELKVIPGPKGTLLINITTSVKMKCERGMSRAQGSRVITTLDNKIQVLCDTETDGGGWIIIQRRINGQVNFSRNWNDYKNGFGTLDGDFWIGNELIANMTSKENYTLRVDMRQGSNAYIAEYDSFMVKNESDKYRLHVGVFSGNIRDSLSYHNNRTFTTPGQDDPVACYCADNYQAGWWYWGCHNANLNGIWGLNCSAAVRGICWLDNSGWKLLNFVEMKIKLK